MLEWLKDRVCDVLLWTAILYWKSFLLMVLASPILAVWGICWFFGLTP